MSGRDDEHKPTRRVIWARLLLLLPFIAMLWVASYNASSRAWPGYRSSTGINCYGLSLGAAIVAFVYLPGALRP